MTLSWNIKSQIYIFHTIPIHDRDLFGFLELPINKYEMTLVHTVTLWLPYIGVSRTPRSSRSSWSCWSQRVWGKTL